MTAHLLLLCLIVGAVLFWRHRRPKQLEDGTWRVVDFSDGLLRVFGAAIALYWSTMIALALLSGLPQFMHTKPMEVLGMGGLALLLWGFVLWHEGRKVVEAVFAAPGELIVPTWPLAIGERVEVTYRRRLHAGRPAGGLDAKLVLYSTIERRRADGTRRKRRERTHVIPLNDGEASYRGKVLEATYRFRVPMDGGAPVAMLGRSLFDLAMGQYRRTEWVLEIEMPLQGIGKLDSRFKLEMTMIPGRSRLHLDAG